MKREITYVFILFSLSLLFLNNCSIGSMQKHNFSVLKDSIQYYKNELGQEVAEKLAFKGAESELKRIISLKESENSQLKTALKKWKKLTSATQIETITNIDTVFIPLKKQIPLSFSRSFQIVDKFYSIFGTVNQAAIQLNKITIPNTQTIISGKKKTGFFKTEYRFEVTNSNPFIKTTQADSYSFTEKKKRFGLGIVGGVSVEQDFFIGLGLSYNLIQF